MGEMAGHDRPRAPASPLSPTEWIVTILLGALTFLAIRNVILNDFYVRGAYFLDEGWFSYVSWRTDAFLRAPAGHPWGPTEYLRTHISLWFYALSGISYLVKTDRIEFFSAWFAALYLAAYVVAFLLARFDAPWRTAAQLNAAPALGRAIYCQLFAFLFAFNGVALANALYPHPEIAIPTAIVLVLMLYARRAYVSGSVALAAALTLRTDAGFHVAIFLVAVAVAESFGGSDGFRQLARNSLRKRYLIPGALAVLYSTVAYVVQAEHFPGGAQFSLIYSGTPFYSHLTAALVLERLSVLLTEKLYVVTPIVGCLLIFFVTRSWIFLFGALAALPWLVLNITARSDAAGTFYTYYSFPFIVLHAWPLLFLNSLPANYWALVRTVALGSLIASVSLSIGPGRSSLLLPSLALQASEATIASVKDMQRRFSLLFDPRSTLVDGGVLSLVAEQVPKSALFVKGRAKPTDADAVVYFQTYLQIFDIQDFGKNWPQKSICRLAGTNIEAMVRDDDLAARLASRGNFACRKP